MRSPRLRHHRLPRMVCTMVARKMDHALCVLPWRGVSSPVLGCTHAGGGSRLRRRPLEHRRLRPALALCIVGLTREVVEQQERIIPCGTRCAGWAHPHHRCDARSYRWRSAESPPELRIRCAAGSLRTAMGQRLGHPCRRRGALSASAIVLARASSRANEVGVFHVERSAPRKSSSIRSTTYSRDCVASISTVAVARSRGSTDA